MITPCTRVRRQYARHQPTSYAAGSASVMLVWPQRSVRRYQGGSSTAPAAARPGSVRPTTPAAAPAAPRNDRRETSALMGGRPPAYARQSLTARPAAARLSSRISEYLRESTTPSAPAFKAAVTAA